MTQQIVLGLAIVMAVLAIVFATWWAIRHAVEARFRTLPRRFLEGAPSAPKPCYRCAAVARTEFMGLHYCLMCREMVSRVYPAALHDPPFGFPGSRGYLEFPAKERRA